MNNLNVQPKSVQSAPASQETSVRLPSIGRDTKDVLQQLHANVRTLEDLTDRLAFVSLEVRSLIRK